MKSEKTKHIGSNNRFEAVVSYVGVIGLIYYMASTLYEASIPLRNKLAINPRYYKGSRFSLPKRWFGMRIDLSDWQWITFDYHFQKQIIFLIIYCLILFIYKYLIKKIFIQKDDTKQKLTFIIRKITYFYFLINLGFNFYLHGTSTVFMLIIMFINYIISISIYKYKYCNIITWIWNLFIAVIISKYDHSYFSFNLLIHPSLTWIDKLITVQMRWNQTYRLTMLRCISFNMDLRSKYLNKSLYKSEFNNGNDLTEINDYSFINYYAYTLYTPLQISGPIISYHNWINQLKVNLIDKSPYKHTELSYKYIIIYILRFIFCYVFFIIWLHFVWTSAFIKYGFPMNVNDLRTTSDYKSYMIILCSFGYLHLSFIWLKFLIIWRFSRLWALCDGIVTEENMKECYSCTSQISSFWKYWHASFNLWNIRYIYIPLGGSKTKNSKYINIIIVFLFTALWHGDYNTSLLLWGTLMGVGMIFEIYLVNWYWITKLNIMMYIRNNNYLNRYIHAICACLIQMLLISANMIGYGPGLDVIIDIWKKLFVTYEGLYVLLWCFSYLIMTSLTIFHIRSMYQNDTFKSISIIQKDNIIYKKKDSTE